MQARDGLAYVTGDAPPPETDDGAWEWMRNPLPPATEGHDFASLRRSLDLPDDRIWATAESLNALRPSERGRVGRMARDFFAEHNPYIRHIVRRTREYLEHEIDSTTNEPFLKPVRVALSGDGADDAITLPTFLRDAYAAAEDFCEEVGKRQGMNIGFLRTILLRRIGSTIVAGRATAEQMLARSSPDDEDDDKATVGGLYPLTEAEEEKLRRFVALIAAAPDDDPKYRIVERLLLHGAGGTGPWLNRGCIVFTQYYDSARWIAGRLSATLSKIAVALYAGGARSGILRAGVFSRLSRDAIKEGVASGDIRLLIGTDAASEGLNLQKLGALINLDLPWNPTRLEQRKGRIQRIGQERDEVLLHNIRYRDSVEDRVHDLLSARLRAVRDLFGQLPDTLEDVWVAVAQRDEQRAREIIDAVPERHPFALRYDRVENVDWESCATVLDSHEQLDALLRGW